MDLPEIEKQLKELGASLMSAREDLKAAKDAPRATPEDVKSIREEIAGLTKRYDELHTLLQKKDEPKSDEKKDENKDKTIARTGFGFFSFR